MGMRECELKAMIEAAFPGAAVTITATSQPLMIESPILLQFVKTESVGATIGVALVEKSE